MVDQVEITNVGDDGVASELTLERLVKSMEKLAKTSGLDPKSQAAKAQKAHTDAVNSEIEVIRKNVAAKKDFNAALKDGTSSLNRFSRGLLGIASQVVGQLTGSALGLSRELNKGSMALTDYAQHLPVVGERLSQVTGILDDTFSSFQTMAKSGGDFAGDLTDMRLVAKQAGMDLSEFSMFVTQNSKDLAGFSGTVSQGAKQVSQMTNQMSDLTREQLLSMGLQMEEITEQMAYFQLLDRAGARTRQFDAERQAEAAASLAENMLTLSKLTGDDIESMREKLAAQQADVAFQMRLAGMTEEQRAKIQQGLNLAIQQYGETGAMFFKQQILGFPPMTEETRLFAATMGESANAVESMATAALDANTSLAEFEESRIDRVVEMVRAAAEDAQGLESILAAGAAGMETGLGSINDAFNSMGIQFTKYVKMVEGNLTFDEEAMRRDAEIALRAQETNTDLVDAMAESQDAFYTAAVALEESFVKPLLDAATPMIKELTGMVDNLTESEVFENFANDTKEFMESLGPIMKDFIDLAKQGPGAVVTEAVRQLWEHPKIVGAMVAGIVGLWASQAVIGAMVGGIGKLIASSMAGDILSDVDVDRRSRGRGRGGRLSRALRGAGDLLRTGGSSAARAGATAARAAPSAISQGARLALPGIAGAGAAVGGGFLIGMTPTAMADATLPSDAGEREALLNSIETINPAIEHLQEMTDRLNGLQDQIERSEAGENVFRGFEGRGRRKAQSEIDNILLSMQKYIEQTGLDEGNIEGGTAEQVQQLIESLNTNMNDINRGSQAEMRELNTIMREVLGVLQEQKDIDDKIQRNTSGITGNIARGRVSNVGR